MLEQRNGFAQSIGVGFGQGQMRVNHSARSMDNNTS
jgi:hypothetical protein